MLKTKSLTGKVKHVLPAYLTGRYWFYICLPILAMACSDKRLAPVVERDATGQQASLIRSEQHSAIDEKLHVYRVKAGDTLYSIAFRFGVDYRVLAKVNGIGERYLIGIGQQLNIDKARNYKAANTHTIASHKPAVNSGSKVKNNSKSTKTVKKESTTKPKSKNKNSTVNKKQPLTAAKQVASKNPPSSTKTVNRVKTKPPVKFANAAVKYWMWPNMGKVIRSFKATRGKGIDIAGNIGDSVRAAAAGRVVYAGSGLRGYGNLVIIKHNNDYISAYAHNKSLIVKENEIIKAGQKIALIGNTGTDTPKLHFEIRFKGKPTNPLKYLPKR